MKDQSTGVTGMSGPAEARLKDTVGKLEKDGVKVQVIGRMVDGKMQLDPKSVEEMSRKFPNAEFAFVAVNAPFDPVRHDS
jgi:hypothetical protein